MGLAVEAMPLSQAEPHGWSVPQGDFDGILLGSANGLRHAGDGIEALAGLPVYAVGAATSDAARERGFTVARTGSGGLQLLLDDLPANRALRLLRLAGEEHVPLTTPAHICVETVITYRVVHLALSQPQIDRLADGGVVLLHSGASARHFESECERTGLDRSGLALAALAPRIAGSVSDGWQSLRIATTATDAALLSLAADMCH